jgi:Tol biopolymer transport system component
MTVARIALVLLCGCGRVGFDAARGEDGGSGAGDAASDVGGDAQIAICHTGAWGTPTVIASTVTSSEEADPWISPDELTLYFESNRSPSSGRAIWFATRATKAAPFGTPVRQLELDDAMDDHDPALNADLTQIWFGSLRTGAAELHTAVRPDSASPFMNPALASITGDSVVPSVGPSLTADGLGLYYGRDLEVAFATRTDTLGAFTFVRELDEINAAPTDGNPTITADGLELFFDSYRNGPAAIFAATRPDTSSLFSGLTELTSLPMVASGIAAGSPDISADGRTLYYWIDLGGQLDLYTSTRSCP